MKYFSWFCFVAILFVLNCGCTKQSSSDTSLGYKTFLSIPEYKTLEHTKTILPINDSEQFLSTTAKYYRINSDSALFSDTKGLHIYTNGSYAQTLGSHGNGPHRYASITAIAVSGDTIFVFDKTNAKILGYSRSKKQCVYELLTTVPVKSAVTSFVRYQGMFIMANCAYVPPEFLSNKNIAAETKGSNTLLFSLNNDGTMGKPLLDRGDIQFYDVFPLINPPWGSCMRIKNDMIYLCVPFAKQAVIVHLSDYKVRTIDIILDIANPTKKIQYSELTMNGLDVVEDIFTTTEGFAILSKIVANNKAKQIVRFYSDAGKCLGYLVNAYSEAYTDTNSFVSYVDDNYFSILYANKPDDKSSFPYSLITQEYQKQ